MSMNVFELFAKLGLDTSEYDKGLKGAASSLTSFGDKITGGVGAAVKGVTAAMAGATAAVGAFAASSVQTGLAFDASMSKVAALSGATGADLDALRDKAKEMGATTMFSASQAADAMGYMGMAGWKADQMLAGLPGIMSLAAASGEDLATTSDIVTDALTAFGLGADQAAHFADVLAAASSNSNTNVSMMGETFKYAAPLAGTLGFNIEDTALAIGLMANTGIKASMAGTSLRSFFNNLAAGGDKAKDALELLGIETQDEQGNMKGLRDIILQLRHAFKVGDGDMEKYNNTVADLNRMLEEGTIDQTQYNDAVEKAAIAAMGATSAQQAQLASAISGKYGMSGLLGIINATDEDFNKLAASIDNSSDSMGAASKMMDTMQDNLQGDLYLIKSAFEAVRLEIAERLMPSVRNFTQLGSDALSNIALATKEKGIPGFIDAIVQAITTDLPKAIKKKLASKKLDILYSIFNAGSTGLNNFINGLIQASGKLKDRFKEFTGSEKFQKFLERLNELSEKMSADRVAILIEGIGTAILRLANALISFVNSDVFMGFLDSLGRWIDRAGPEGIADKIEGVAKALTALVVAAKALAAVQGVVSVLSSIGGAVKGLEALKGLNLATKLGGLSSGLSGLGSSVAGLGSAASAVPTLMASDISLMGAATATEVGMTIGTTIAAGIAAAIAGYNGGKWGAWLVATLTGDIETAELYKNFNLAEGIKSLDNPNQGALEDAQDMLDGYVDMVTDFKENPVIAWLTTGVTVAGTGPLAPLILGFAEFKKITEGIDWEGLKSKVSEFGESYGAYAGAIWTDFGTAVQNGLNMIVSGIKNAITVHFNVLTFQIRFLWENWGKSAVSAIEQSGIGEAVLNFFVNLGGAIALTWEERIGQVQLITDGLATYFETIWGTIGSLWEERIAQIETALNGLQEFTVNLCGAIGLVWEERIAQIQVVTDTLLTYFETFWGAVLLTWQDRISQIQVITDGLLTYFETFWGAVGLVWEERIEQLKTVWSAFTGWIQENFKLPHITFEGELDIKNGKIPEIKVDWYSKAMDNAMVLNGPTIFGASNGKLMGGGEAGSEVVSGTSTLMNMIQTAVASTQQPITVIMEMDDRELGRTVYQLNNAETQRVGVRLANV